MSPVESGKIPSTGANIGRDAPWLRPRQRIFQRGKRRLSIRLEEEFWTQLDHCAKEDRIKVADLVFGVSNGQDDPGNRSSMLRAYCVRWLRQKLIEARFLKSSVNLNGILAACPVPCLIIMPDKKIAARNQVFAHKILSTFVPPDKWGETDAIVRLSLSKPIEQIVSGLTGGEAGHVEAHVGFTSGKDSLQAIGRFCLLNRSKGQASPLLCFLRGMGEL